MIKEVLLSEKAFIYIRNELSRGGYLSNNIQELNLENGYVFAFLPSSIEPNNIKDYAESLTYLSGENVTAEIENIVIKFISDYLDFGENRFAFFETIWEKGDPIISRRQLDYFYIHSRKYDYIWGKDKLKRIKEYLYDAQGYPTVIVLSHLFKKSNILIQASELDESIIANIIENMDCFIIMAFDGDGYLIWRNEKR